MASEDESSNDHRGKVISQFKVFWNDASPEQVVVLQFPNRSRDLPYNQAKGLKPTQIRMKPNTGLVEIDVPLHTQAREHFNKEKAFQFGSHLAKNKIIQSGGSFGLAGGFGVGGISNRRARGADDPMDTIHGFDEAYEVAETEGKVMKTLTLSGKIQTFRDGDPIYAMATFRKDEMHLTRVNAICSLSPQYTHLDAALDNEKSSRMRDAEIGGSEAEARAINISMRSTEIENVAPDDIGKTLRALQEEPWQKMQWIDEEDDQAYLRFKNHLFYRETGDGQKLVSAMSPLTYLDAISAPKVDDKVRGQRITQQHKASVAEDWEETTDTEESDIELMQEEGQRRQLAVN